MLITLRGQGLTLTNFFIFYFLFFLTIILIELPCNKRLLLEHSPLIQHNKKFLHTLLTLVPYCYLLTRAYKNKNKKTSRQLIAKVLV